MKKYRLLNRSDINNWLKDKETRDDIRHLVATKWATKTKGIASYGRTHLPKPVKTVLRTTVKNPLDAAMRYRADRKELAKTPVQTSSAKEPVKTLKQAGGAVE